MASPNIIIRDTFLEAWNKGFNDPIYFINNFLDRDVHIGQHQWCVGGMPYAKERFLHAANRWGKTNIAGYLQTWKAFYQKRGKEFDVDPRSGRLKPYAAIFISMSLDQARIAWNYAIDAIESSPRMKPFLQETKETPFPVFILANGKRGEDRAYSEVWARSTAKKARYILGRKYNTIAYDEAAYDPDLQEIVENVLRMRLIDEDGDIDFTSTPNGMNYYYELCQSGMVNTPTYAGPRYYTQQGYTLENTFITGKQSGLDALESQAKRMSKEMVRQNIFGDFVEFASLFPWEDVLKCYRDQDYSLPVEPDTYVEMVENFEGDRLEAKVIRKPGTYVVGVDLGRKQDPTCIIVLRTDIVPCQIHYFRLIEKASKWEHIYQAVAEVVNKYHALIMIDATATGGDQAEQALSGEPYNLTVVPFIFTHTSKINIIQRLQESVQLRQIVFPYIESLVRSLTLYQFEDKKLFTDPVMALALAWNLYVDNALKNLKRFDGPDAIAAGIHYDFREGLWVPRTDYLIKGQGEFDPLAALVEGEEPIDFEGFEMELANRNYPISPDEDELI